MLAQAVGSGSGEVAPARSNSVEQVVLDGDDGEDARFEAELQRAILASLQSAAAAAANSGSSSGRSADAPQPSPCTAHITTSADARHNQRQQQRQQQQQLIVPPSCGSLPPLQHAASKRAACAPGAGRKVSKFEAMQAAPLDGGAMSLDVVHLDNSLVSKAALRQQRARNGGDGSHSDTIAGGEGHTKSVQMAAPVQQPAKRAKHVEQMELSTSSLNYAANSDSSHGDADQQLDEYQHQRQQERKQGQLDAEVESRWGVHGRASMEVALPVSPHSSSGGGSGGSSSIRKFYVHQEVWWASPEGDYVEGVVQSTHYDDAMAGAAHWGCGPAEAAAAWPTYMVELFGADVKYVEARGSQLLLRLSPGQEVLARMGDGVGAWGYATVVGTRRTPSHQLLVEVATAGHELCRLEPGLVEPIADIGESSSSSGGTAYCG